MIALICFVLAVLASPFKSKSRLEALGGFTITSGFEFSVHTVAAKRAATVPGSTVLGGSTFAPMALRCGTGAG